MDNEIEIRLDSIGGLGANIVGKILGECLCIEMGYNATNFSSYGSEKRGSPVKSYIRAKKDGEIRLTTPVIKPDILGIFSEALVKKAETLSGCDENTKIIINTPCGFDETVEKMNLYGGNLYLIDALKTAREKKTRTNMVLLGAIVKASGFIPLEAIIQTVENTLGKKYPKALENNIEGIKAGYNEVKNKVFKNNREYPYIENKRQKSLWGYDNAPIGGINPLFGNTITNDLSSSREGYVPIFHKEKCINCGLCDTTCPDMVYQFRDGENLGPDYHYCKGCLRCVEVCPTKAITEAMEYEVTLKGINNIDLIRDIPHFTDVGANSWINSESETNTI